MEIDWASTATHAADAQPENIEVSGRERSSLRMWNTVEI
jgi:hypothetical protein